MRRSLTPLRKQLYSANKNCRWSKRSPKVWNKQRSACLQEISYNHFHVECDKNDYRRRREYNVRSTTFHAPSTILKLFNNTIVLVPYIDHVAHHIMEIRHSLTSQQLQYIDHVAHLIMETRHSLTSQQLPLLISYYHSNYYITLRTA